MTDLVEARAAALIAAKEHAQNSWYRFVRQRNFKAIVPSWRVGETEDGSPRLSTEVVGQGAAYALDQFARTYHLALKPGDIRPQFDIDQPGRTVVVWRYGGVWVELWHPDSAAAAPVPVVPVQGAPTPSPSGLRALLRRPSGRLPYTRKPRTTNPKENSTT